VLHTRAAQGPPRSPGPTTRGDTASIRGVEPR
jgi:hypothetical protein